MLNDLLDPSGANLKLRENPKRGFYVEGIKEETLVSAEHALSIIATGVAHRKVSPRLYAAQQISPHIVKCSGISYTCGTSCRSFRSSINTVQDLCLVDSDRQKPFRKSRDAIPKVSSTALAREFQGLC